MTFIITLANLKGGAGKTTTAVNLAAGLARQGRRTLLVDADPQANATLHLSINPDDVEYSLASLLQRSATLQDAVRTIHDHFDLLPASIDLDPLEYRLVTDPAAALLFQRQLRATSHEVVVIDTRPSIGFLTSSALLAADLVLIPLPPEYFAANSFLRTIDRLTDIAHAAGRTPVARVVFTMLDRRGRFHAETCRDLRPSLQAHSTPIDLRGCASVIRINADLKRAAALGGDIFRLAPSSRGAADYGELTRELTETTNL